MNYRTKVSAAVLISLIYFSISGYSFPQEYGQVSVKKWADDRKSAFTFTFDDGCMTQYTYAKPILDSFGFKGTFFVVNSLLTDDLPGILRYGTWNQFRSMALEGHEIGSHTETHPDLTTLINGDTTTPGTLLYELHHSKITIDQKIFNQKCITIAYPNLAYDSNVVDKTKQFYESARAGGSYPNDSSLTDSGFYNMRGYQEYFNSPRDSIQDDMDELQDCETYVQNSINYGQWGMLGAHEVVPFSQIPVLMQSEWYPMSTEWLTLLCQWLKQKSDDKDIWVETMGNITRYMKEREHFQYNISSITETQIQINPTDNLNNQIYNYPLTIDITVPPDWKAAIVTQGSNVNTINTTIAGVDTFIRTYVIPNGGPLILDKTDEVLPVELASFTVAVTNKSVHLKWRTFTEINNSRFDVERMIENKSWEKVGSIPGAGNSYSPKNYSFIDNLPLQSGKYFYRLKQIDNDGNYKYSGKVEVYINLVPQNYSLRQNYPNPFNPSTRIHYELTSKQFVTLKIYDVLGIELQTLVNEEKQPGAYEVTWIAENLPSGVYYYRINAGSFVETKKMVLLK